MPISTGIYEFKDKKTLDRLTWVAVELQGSSNKVKIKYINEYPKGDPNKLQPVYGEAFVANLRSTNGTEYHGSVQLPQKHQGAIAFEQILPSELSVWCSGGQWVNSASRKDFPIATDKPMWIGRLMLPPCCVASFRKLNNLPALMGKIDFINILGDVAAIVDCGSGMAQALNSAIQKAGSNGAPAPSTMLTSVVRLKIQEEAISKIAMHRGTPLGDFWSEVQRAWSKG